MVAVMLLLALATTPSETEKEVTAPEKKAFLELLAKLPTKGEFFTAEAVKKAAPHTRVLLALTQKDLEKYDLYPFLALSRGLLDSKEQRDYGAKHFGQIAHPTIQLFWAVVLFDEKAASPEVIKFLQKALDSKEQAAELSKICGPKFEDFKKRVKETKVKEK